MSDHPQHHDIGHEALTSALNVSFRVLRWVMAFVLLAYVFSGLFVVAEQERAYVLVFGKISGLGTERLQGPGLHWTWPRPIAEVVRIPTKRIQTVDSKTFWYHEEKQPLPGPDGKPAPPPATLKPGTDGYTLTGDANLMHSMWAVRYSVTDPEVVRFHLRDLDGLLQRELDHAVLKSSIQFPIDRALRTDIEAFRGAVDAEIRRRVETLGLGIHIERVDILDLAPPRQVADAFNSVIASENERSEKISAARAAASRTLNEAQGEAARSLAEGRTYKRNIVAEVAANAEYFTKVYEQYQKNPNIIARTLLQDTLRRTLDEVDQKFLIRRNDHGQQELRLLLNPEPKPIGEIK